MSMNDINTYSIVLSLINTRLDPSILLTKSNNLLNLLRTEIAQSELLKLARLVTLVNGFECLCEFGLTIGGM